MNNVTKLIPAPSLPADLAGKLRQLAEDVEDGRVTAMAIGYVCDGSYAFLWPSSLTDSLTISTLMQARALDNVRGNLDPTAREET